MVRGVAWDALARYEEGYALIFWSGLLERESHLASRFIELGPDLLELAAPGTQPVAGNCLLRGP